MWAKHETYVLLYIKYSFSVCMQPSFQVLLYDAITHDTTEATGHLGWIDLVQDRDWWKALVNTAMTLRVP
jgi:hypothetical protein